MQVQIKSFMYEKIFLNVILPMTFNCQALNFLKILSTPMTKKPLSY